MSMISFICSVIQWGRLLYCTPFIGKGESSREVKWHRLAFVPRSSAPTVDAEGGRAGWCKAGTRTQVLDILFGALSPDSFLQICGFQLCSMNLLGHKEVWRPSAGIEREVKLVWLSCPKFQLFGLLWDTILCYIILCTMWYIMI